MNFYYGRRLFVYCTTDHTLSSGLSIYFKCLCMLLVGHMWINVYLAWPYTGCWKRKKVDLQKQKTQKTHAIFIDYHCCSINKLCNRGGKVKDWILSTSIDIAGYQWSESDCTSKTCLNRTALWPTYPFRIDKFLTKISYNGTSSKVRFIQGLFSTDYIVNCINKYQIYIESVLGWLGYDF